jgi:predicted alpha/beta hydrolase family esterase
VDALGLKDFTLVVQGFFVPAALQYAKANEARVNQLILINPPVKEQHAKLPSSLAAFSTFLLGDVFAQV